MKSLALLAAAALAAVSTTACDDSDGGPRADLRIVHASPDAPDVDVRLDGIGVLSQVPYLASSGYLSVQADDRDVQVLAAGTETVVIDATLTLPAGSATTVLAANLVANIEPLVLADDRSAPAAGNAKVRVVHGAPSAPNVDVYVTAPGAALTDPTLADVPFLASSDYLEIPAGEYQVRVTVAGTTDVAIDTGALTIADGAVLSAVAVDAAGGGAPFDILVLDDAL